MKKYLLFLLVVTLSLSVKAQKAKYDTAAITILDRMSDIIGDLHSCSFILHTATDRPDEYGISTHFGVSEVYMVGPNKMTVNTFNEKGHRGYFYNGSKLHYYSYDENNYAEIDAPDNIMATIDKGHNDYGIDFPAADFFYPTFTDDLINSSDQISYLGKVKIYDRECFHVLAKGKEMTVQFWITNDAKTLPEKMVIIYNNNKETSRYEASFSDWKVNPDLPASMFEFMPPPRAHLIQILSRKAKE